MTKSLFSKIYSYRERDNKGSKENFLIEIFAFCLQSDYQFFTAFLKELNIKAEIDYWVKTQVVYEQGRPDIEVFLNKSNTSILIECKIEHLERHNQLNDYKKILDSKTCKDKHLVYLTKYYDIKEIESTGITFHNKKWADIFSIISEENQQLTIQLKNYIKDENMAESNNFQYNDIALLNQVGATIRKMDEVLDGVRPFFEKQIGNLSKESARSTRLKDNWYANYHDVYNQKVFQYGISIGFFWWDENGEIYLALRVYISDKGKNKSNANQKLLFDKYLKNWEVETWDECHNYWHYRSVAKFILENEEQIPEMIKFLRQGLDELSALKKIDAKIFG